MDYMGLDLPDISVDNLHLPLRVSAGVSSNRVGVFLEKRRPWLLQQEKEGREEGLWPQHWSQDSWTRGCHPLGKVQISSAAREGDRSDPSHVWPGDVRAGSISKEKFSLDGSYSTEWGYAKILCKFLTFTKQSLFLEQTLSPPLSWCVKQGRFDVPLFPIVQ